MQAAVEKRRNAWGTQMCEKCVNGKKVEQK